ncbi:MAG: iron ABC transporter permease [Desulfobacteraceae bacterium]|nr:MAG: iron ABC transporter permease [Desulfobacteraceae bacterium]
MSAVVKRILAVSAMLSLVLLAAMVAGVGFGSSGGGLADFLETFSSAGNPDATLHAIVWKIRFPRVVIAALVGATLSLGGLVFQALLRNPLAEPYILGISGGSAIGAIIGILLNFSRFPGVSLFAFSGGMGTLLLVLLLSTGRSLLKKEALLLSGVMVNAFCSAVIMFLISLTQDARLNNIMFWLMGDLSSGGQAEAVIMGLMLAPCFLILFWFANYMNLLLMGKETAQSLGVNVRAITLSLLILTSFMVSATVCYCGLVAFVGLVIPHLFRLILGGDHRVLVPACVFGGGAYLVLCDLLARTLPRQGEMPVGVITALIGAPVFIFLLKRSR